MQLTIIDRTVNANKSVEALFEMAMLNGIGITDDVAESVALNLPVTDFPVVPVIINKPATLKINIKQAVKRFQKTTDFVTQFSGALENLFEMAIMNGIGITDDILPGSMLYVNAKNKSVVNFYKNSHIDIITPEQRLLQQPGGIGYMQIGRNFIVS